jgi:hypothetical protein
MMRDIVAKLLNSQEGIVLFVVMIMIGTNVLLMSALKVLGWIKDKTETQADNKLHALLSKGASVLSKVLAFLSANSALLPPKAKAELDKKEWLQSGPEAQAVAESIAEKLKQEESKE